MAWPRLREELGLYAGPRLADGQPSWVLHDPVRNLFFRIDWLSFELISHWALADPEMILNAVASGTTLRPQPDDLQSVQAFLVENQLLVPDGENGSAALAERCRKQRSSWWRWLLHHYLFFRLPLVRPDRWLERMLPHVAVFYAPLFRRLTVLALLLGLGLVYRDWDRFSATLVDTFSFEGLLGYGVTLTVVKSLHELGHAFTAKRHGCRVPAMGVAFLVMWPMAYTDTNEVWKLADRRKRLAVAAAGIGTELGLAAWATLFWGVLPEGGLKAAAFMLATTVWVATLAINSSPFMRFDGYFLLSDWLDMPNLHGRAFALARWDLRERLFALGEPKPEFFPPAREKALILFAWATWLYRLMLFLGIAVLVYHFFVKALGILLFAVEIGWFVLLPVWSEVKAWRTRWPAIRASRRFRRCLAGLGVFLVLFVLPWPARLSASGLLRPAEVFAVYAPAGAQVVALPVANRERIEADQLLIQLASADLQRRWERANARATSLRWQAAVAGVDGEQRQNLQVLQEERAVAEAELAAVQAELALYAPRAPFAGRLVDLDPDLRPGHWVGRNEKLATLVRDDAWIVETFLDEELVRRVRVGDRAFFRTDGADGGLVPLRVSTVDHDATRVLPAPVLATAFGGELMTREKNGQHIPERATFRVVLSVSEMPRALDDGSWRGHVVIQGDWEAPGMRFLRAAFAVLWREAGF